MPAAEMTVRIGADISGLRAALNEIRQGIKGAFSEEALAMSRKVVTGIAAFGAAALGAGVASVKMAGDMEQTQIAFATLLGSADAARSFLDDLQQFAARTPFEFPGLAEASKRLLAFGFSAQSIIPMMTAIGDAAAGLGLGAEGIDRMTVALGQMRAKGKASAEEMMQLAEAGVPAWEYLAKAVGVSTGQAMELVRKGAIDSQTVITAVLQGMSSQFGGLMEQQAQTINGGLSNIKDAVGMIMREIGQDISEAFNLKGVFADAAKWLTDFAKMVKECGLSEALDRMIPPGVRIAIVALAGAIMGAAVPALLNMATAAFFALMDLLPVIAIGTAVATAAYLIYKAWDPLGRWFGALWDAIKAAFQIGGAGINIVLKEITLGLAQFLEYALARVADFGAGLGSVVSQIPLLGGIGKALTEASAGLRAWLAGFKASAAANLDAAKAGLYGAQQSWESATHYMGVFGRQVVDSIKGTVSDGLSKVADGFKGIKDAGADAGKGIVAGLQPAADQISGMTAGLDDLKAKLSSLGGGKSDRADQQSSSILEGDYSAVGSFFDKLHEGVGAGYEENLFAYMRALGITSRIEGEARFDQALFERWKAGGMRIVDGIPQLASGGIVTEPTLALIGERGPEAVIPLDRAEAATTINIAPGAVQISAKDLREFNDVIDFFQSLPQVARQYSGGGR